MEELKVEIWSDISCPFCYLGKKRFEAALEQFPYKDRVNTEWRSFQLDPYLVTMQHTNIYDHLAEVKGISREESVRAHEQIVLQARQIGLEYNFDKVVVANSFHAHRLTHLAKKYNVSDAMEERLFKAYFTDGENISDPETLLKLGKEVGLPEDETEVMLNSEDYTDNVLRDEEYARELGITGVPFFLFNENLSVRGAQPPETFLRALLKSWEMMTSPAKTGENVKSYFFRRI